MPADDVLNHVLAQYGLSCVPSQIRPIRGAGFSGAKLWQVGVAPTAWCLRRWPQEHPSVAQLEFIHGVLRHVAQRGFHRLAVPREAHGGLTYVNYAAHLWELSAWITGEASYRISPSLTKLQGALIALAQFHGASATFPSLQPALGPSPGLV